MDNKIKLDSEQTKKAKPYHTPTLIGMGKLLEETKGHIGSHADEGTYKADN